MLERTRLGDFYHGVFIAPQQRLSAASRELPPWLTVLPLVPYALILVAGGLARRIRFGQTAIVCVRGVAGVSPRVFPPSGSVSDDLESGPAPEYGRRGRGRSAAGPRRDIDGLEHSRPAAAGGAVAAFGSLIEFPFAAAIYFCYTPPLVALTVNAVVGSEPVGAPAAAPRHRRGADDIRVARLNTGFIFNLGTESDRYQVVPSKLRRIGLRITADERFVYQKLLGLILSHGAGRYVYATPDCPEVYFISGMANPTRTFYETFDQRPKTAAEVLKLIEDHGITVVVINRVPEFSGPLNREIDAALEARFPQSDQAGRFLVRWRTVSALDRLMENVHVYRLWQAPFAEQKFAPVVRHNDLRHVTAASISAAVRARMRAISRRPGTWVSIGIPPTWTMPAATTEASSKSPMSATRKSPPGAASISSWPTASSTIFPTTTRAG